MHSKETKTCLLKSCYKDIHSNIILWPPDTENRLIGKDSDTGKNEDEMTEWCHLFSGHEFEQILEDGEEQGGMACCSPWGSQSQTLVSN